jgi:hypothetical protein
MPLFVELRDGHTSLDQSSSIPGSPGPVIGPLVSARLLRGDLRVGTTQKEYSLAFIADWVFYGGRYYSDAEIIGSDQIGEARTRRMVPFNPALAEL